jgi:uncharacterized membrane protein
MSDWRSYALTLAIGIAAAVALMRWAACDAAMC